MEDEEDKLQLQQPLIDATAEEWKMLPASTSRQTCSDSILRITQGGTASPRKKFQLSNSHEDRISNLPDCITSHILSCLHTEDAVATSVLSRSWRYKWTSVYDICPTTTYLFPYTEDDSYRDASFQNFRIFINRLLNNPWRLRSFNLRLSGNWDYYQDIPEWTAAAFRRNIQNLEIVAGLTDCTDSPQCFSGWTSLTELKLCLKCTLCVSARNWFSNLKSLCLRDHVHIENEESWKTRRILLMFPVLEDLELIYCEWIGIDSVEIEAPKLIRLTSKSLEDQMHNLRVNAPAVTYASIHQQFCYNFAQICKMLKGFRNLRRLSLPYRSLKDLAKEPTLDFSAHDRLEELDIGTRRCYVDRAVLLEILEAFPYVQSINMNVRISRPRKRLHVVEHLPLCIRSRLKKFKYNRFDGKMSKYDLAFVELILKNAKNLQRVIVAGLYEEHAAMLQQHFSGLTPEGSSYALSAGKYDDIW